MFTRAMFTKTPGGALAMARYYIDARNWAEATGIPVAFSIVCDSSKCAHDIPFFTARIKADQHAIGGRTTTGPPVLFAAPKSIPADYVVQVKAASGAERIVGADGKVVDRIAKLVALENIYLKWSGRMWRVSGEFLAG